MLAMWCRLGRREAVNPGWRLRRFREAAELTQVELAARSGSDPRSDLQSGAGPSRAAGVDGATLGAGLGRGASGVRHRNRDRTGVDDREAARAWRAGQPCPDVAADESARPGLEGLRSMAGRGGQRARSSQVGCAVSSRRLDPRSARLIIQNATLQKNSADMLLSAIDVVSPIRRLLMCWRAPVEAEMRASDGKRHSFVDHAHCRRRVDRRAGALLTRCRSSRPHSKRLRLKRDAFLRRRSSDGPPPALRLSGPIPCRSIASFGRRNS